MTMPGRLPLPNTFGFFLVGDRPVVMENEVYSTLILFSSPYQAQQWHAACVDGTPEDTEMQGNLVETVEGLERLYGMLPEKVRYVIVDPPPRRDTALEGSMVLGEFLDSAREAARRHAQVGD